MPMNIMVIDDDPLVLALLRRQLINLECKTVAVHQNAEAALTALSGANEAADLIFCDIQMPEMDGVELIRHLAGERYRGGLVLMSGEDERILQTVQSLARGHGLRVVAAVQKPIHPEQLNQIFAEHRRGRGGHAATVVQPYDLQSVQRAIGEGELVNHYQPKVRLSTGEVVGVEVLVRWQHPRDGMVYPDRFIATAERFHLIDALTRVVLVEALSQCRAWQNDNLHLSVAVNISMQNLGSVDYPDFISRLAADAGVDLTCLVLEVTESQLMGNRLMALDILTRLRLKNIVLSIDDFGTGHSSLLQLRDVPFNELKVDAGFVHDAVRDRSRRAILEASLDMARRLGIRTVAEGVENIDDWRFLAMQTQCDLAQGYFIGKPMPASALPDWLRQWEERRQDLVNLKS